MLKDFQMLKYFLLYQRCLLCRLQHLYLRYLPHQLYRGCQRLPVLHLYRHFLLCLCFLLRQPRLDYLHRLVYDLYQLHLLYLDYLLHLRHLGYPVSQLLLLYQQYLRRLGYPLHPRYQDYQLSLL